jgi:hypothetical protein
MKITKTEQFNILLSGDEARALRAIMQNPMCTSLKPKNDSPCGTCKSCMLSKTIFEALK